MITRILAYLLALILLVGGGVYAGYHFTDKYWDAKYTSKISEINQDSVNRINLANTAKLKAEQTQQAAVETAKRNYDTTIVTLNNTVAALRAERVVLHDPGRRKIYHTARPAATTGTGSSIISSSSGSAISSGATDFLLGFAQRADTVRAALLECQADDTSIRIAVTSYNDSLKQISADTSKQAQKDAETQ